MGCLLRSGREGRGQRLVGVAFRHGVERQDLDLAGVARRAERELVKLVQAGNDESLCLRYLNRLSDLFFVWARRCNDDGRADLLWQRARDQKVPHAK